MRAAQAVTPTTRCRRLASMTAWHVARKSMTIAIHTRIACMAREVPSQNESGCSRSPSLLQRGSGARLQAIAPSCSADMGRHIGVLAATVQYKKSARSAQSCSLRVPFDVDDGQGRSPRRSSLGLRRGCWRQRSVPLCHGWPLCTLCGANLQTFPEDSACMTSWFADLLLLIFSIRILRRIFISVYSDIMSTWVLQAARGTSFTAEGFMRFGALALLQAANGELGMAFFEGFGVGFMGERTHVEIEVCVKVPGVAPDLHHRGCLVGAPHDRRVAVLLRSVDLRSPETACELGLPLAQGLRDAACRRVDGLACRRDALACPRRWGVQGAPTGFLGRRCVVVMRCRCIDCVAAMQARECYTHGCIEGLRIDRGTARGWLGEHRQRLNDGRLLFHEGDAVGLGRRYRRQTCCFPPHGMVKISMQVQSLLHGSNVHRSESDGVLGQSCSCSTSQWPRAGAAAAPLRAQHRRRFGDPIEILMAIWRLAALGLDDHRHGVAQRRLGDARAEGRGSRPRALQEAEQPLSSVGACHLS